MDRHVLEGKIVNDQGHWMINDKDITSVLSKYTNSEVRLIIEPQSSSSNR